MILFLTLLSGICWTIVYIESIRMGFKNKTYAMPIFALALNIGWEGLYAYVDMNNSLTNIQSWVNLIWFILDLVIIYTYFKYGKKEFTNYTKNKHFVPISIFIFAMAFAIQYSFLVEFGNHGSWYSAFLQNLIMSILYLNMLFHRQSTKGQSLLIAVCKWIGTLAPTILFGVIRGNQLVLVLGILCTVFDVAYLYYLNEYRKAKLPHYDHLNQSIQGATAL